MTAKKINRRLGVVLSDLHIPFQDKAACKQAIGFVREHRPGTVHLLGDIGDFYQISRFDKNPARKETLQEDIGQLVGFLGELRSACGGARIIYSEGNHENRLARYMASKAPGFAGLECLELPKLLDFDKLKIQYRTEREPYRIGALLFTHGQLVRKWSAYSARAHFEKYGCCVIHGHTHRLGVFYHRDINDTFGAWENGCLCTLNPEYVVAPDWQHGWSAVWTHEKYFHVEQVIIVKGRFNYHGKTQGRMQLSPTAHFRVEDIGDR